MRLQMTLFLMAKADEPRMKLQPEHDEVEACTGVLRARGQAIGASRLRRAVMSPEATMLMQA